MKFKIETTSKDLSAFGGAPIIDEILKTTNFANLYATALPILKYKGEEDSLLKLKAMVCGLINGCECLDDMEDCSQDTAYLQLVERSYTPRTYGNFLRSFKEVNIGKLQEGTIRMNLMLRSELEKSLVAEGKIDKNLMILDCDSTKNRQYAKKNAGSRTESREVPVARYPKYL